MANSKRIYLCTRHDGLVPRELLLVKKVQFTEMGAGGKVQKSRVVDWLCPDCVVKDADWNREEFKAPGQTPLSKMVSLQ